MGVSYIINLRVSSRYMTPTSAFTKFVCFALFSACVGNTNKKFDDNINFKDTLNNTLIHAVNNGDTMWQYDKIYFTPTNLAVDTSNFCYEVCKLPCSNQDFYKIYFEREKVVAFCDSMLTALPPYENQDDNYIFYQRHIYEHIKEQAAKNKMDEVINVNEMAILLDRFNPLILNRATGDKPKYIIIKHENLITSDLKTYDIKGKLGDTINLVVTIGEIQLRNF
jgi:hypothetical protein